MNLIICYQSTGKRGAREDPRQSIKVKDDIAENMGKSLNLWNSMMFNLNNKATIN